MLTERQLAAVAPLLGEELEDAVRICRGIPQRNQVHFSALFSTGCTM